MSKNYVDFNDAFELSLKSAQEIQINENIFIENSLQRVLAKDIICIKNLPSFNNSAMDGFAIKACDAGAELEVITSIFAGDKQAPILQKLQCYKIMTGAQVPDDVDTIIPLENVIFFKDKTVKIPQNIKKGDALRLKGEECKIGEILFKAGQEITSGTIAVLASQGIVSISVKKKLSIAVVSTGSELKEPWESSSDNDVYNCNSFAVISVLKKNGFDASYIKAIPDNLEDTVEFIKNMKNYNLIITSGGISMGDADFINLAFTKNGLKTIYNGVNIKPGKPIMVGTMQDTFAVCLPGNPLTALVNLHLFALPILRKIQGYKSYFHDTLSATNTENFNVKSGRVNVVLGSLSDGKFTSFKKNRYGSGMVSVFSKCNAMLITKKERTSINAGLDVRLISLNSIYADLKREMLN